MNNRIQELIQQSMVEHQFDTRFSPEKFAELVILECAGVTLDYRNEDYYTGWCDHAAEILNHFGVQECK